MTGLASSLVDWSALWKIVVAAFIAGAGAVMVFGVLLLSLQRSTAANNPGIRLLHRAVVAVCSACCIGAVAFGIYAMADKPSAKPAPKPASSPASRTAQQREAWSRLSGVSYRQATSMTDHEGLARGG